MVIRRKKRVRENQIGLLDNMQNPDWKNQNKDHVIKFKIGTIYVLTYEEITYDLTYEHIPYVIT